MTTSAEIVEGGTIPNRGTLVMPATIKQDGAAMNLTGKTVTATLRAEGDHATVIDASLEDHAVALTTPASGIATLTVANADLQKLSVPSKPWQTRPYLVVWRVVEDDYFPQMVRVNVHGVID